MISMVTLSLPFQWSITVKNSELLEALSVVWLASLQRMAFSKVAWKWPALAEDVSGRWHSFPPPHPSSTVSVTVYFLRLWFLVSECECVSDCKMDQLSRPLRVSGVRWGKWKHGMSLWLQTPSISAAPLISFTALGRNVGPHSQRPTNPADLLATGKKTLWILENVSISRCLPWELGHSVTYNVM